MASASSISYYVDVFSTLTTGTLCGIGGCPAGSTSTYNDGSASSITLTLPKFDQAGNVDEGSPSANHIFTLTSVALALDWKMMGNVTVYNFYNGSVGFTNAEASTNMTLTSGGTQVVGAGAAGTGAGTAVCCNIVNGPSVYVGSTTFNGLTGSGSNSQFAANVPFFEGFGVSTVSAGLNTDAVTASGSSTDPHAASLAYNGTGQMGAIMTITYNYTETAIPEPGTMALMGSSLLALGMVIRRRAAQR